MKNKGSRRGKYWLEPNIGWSHVDTHAGGSSAKYGTYSQAEASPLGAPYLHIEVTHASIGVHNEHFLHHRRRGCNRCCCRLPRTARLKQTIRYDVDLNLGHAAEWRRLGGLTAS